MLAQKKISKTKLAVNLAVIMIMLAGTAFMAYKNKKLTFPGGAKTVQSPLNSAASGLLAIPEPAELNQAVDLDKIKKSGGLDLTIFLSEKFKQLKESDFLTKQPAEVGKRDPFKPN